VIACLTAIVTPSSFDRDTINLFRASFEYAAFAAAFLA
jgi:hypothetical protein